MQIFLNKINHCTTGWMEVGKCNSVLPSTHPITDLSRTNTFKDDLCEFLDFITSADVFILWLSRNLQFKPKYFFNKSNGHLSLTTDSDIVKLVISL